MAKKRLSLWLFVPLCLAAGVVGFFVFGAAADLLFSEAAIGPVGLVGFAGSIGAFIWHRGRGPNILLTDLPDASNLYDGIADGNIEHATSSAPFWIIGAAVLGFGALVFVYFGSESSTLEVQVRYGLLTTLAITNTGREPVTILDVTINDRLECAPLKSGGPENPKYYPPEVLKVGDTTLRFPRCGVVRAVMRTDKSTQEYSFSQR